MTKTILVSILVLNSLAHAGDFTPDKKTGWSVSKLIERAEENSSNLKAAKLESEAADAQTNQAGRWDNPEISLGAGKKEVSVLPGSTFEVGVKQSIPLFGQKRAAKDVERSNQSLVNENYRQQGIKLSHLILNEAYLFAATQIHSKHTEHRRENINLIGQYLKTRPFAAPAQAVEKSLVENRIREIEEKFLELGSTRLRAWNELNQNLNFREIIEPDVLWFEKPLALNETEFRADYINNHPDLLKQELVLRRSDAQISLVGKKVYPEIRLGAGYSYEYVELPEKSYFGVLEFTIPIWDAGGPAQHAAQASRIAEESHLQSIRTRVSSEFEQSWTEYAEAKRRLELFPLKLVATLEADMKKAENNWRRGLVSAPSFLELENQVHEQADHVYEAQVQYVKAVSDLYLLTGRKPPNELIQAEAK